MSACRQRSADVLFAGYDLLHGHKRIRSHRLFDAMTTMPFCLYMYLISSEFNVLATNIIISKSEHQNFNSTRKPCCRKKTARCHSCSSRFKVCRQTFTTSVIAANSGVANRGHGCMFPRRTWKIAFVSDFWGFPQTTTGALPLDPAPRGTFVLQAAKLRKPCFRTPNIPALNNLTQNSHSRSCVLEPVETRPGTK